MRKVLVLMNNSVHIDNGTVNYNRAVYGYAIHQPVLGKNFTIYDEDKHPIFGTTPVISTRLSKVPEGKVHFKDDQTIIFKTRNSEYEIFFNQDFDKSKIVD